MYKDLKAMLVSTANYIEKSDESGKRKGFAEAVGRLVSLMEGDEDFEKAFEFAFQNTFKDDFKKALDDTMKAYAMTIKAIAESGEKEKKSNDYKA